jgi:hypothetical protein
LQRLGGFPAAPDPIETMPVRDRQRNEIAQQVVPLLLLGAGLVTTNRFVTFIDDEGWALNFAVRPVRSTLAQFAPGQVPPYPHTPLFDLLLHFWLRWTSGNFDYLRIPSIFFFLAGLFLLGRASRHFMGPSGGNAVIWAGVLWPFGFHFGRLAIWYACTFFLVSGLTLAYLKYLEAPGIGRWAALVLFGLGLIWTNYLGWAIFGCLAIDLLFQPRNAGSSSRLKALAAAAGLWGLAFLPFLPAFWKTLQTNVNVHPRALTIVANAAFCVYSLFVSESVAPWFWLLSIPVGLAVLLCVALVVWWTPRPVLCFLLYGASLITVMALIGILNTKRLLMLSPWILLPIGVAIETAKPRWASFGLTAALLTIGAIGWYGIYAKHYYSAPRFIEPWQEVATDAAAKIRGGATVIADHPSFRLYLTYLLHVPHQEGPWQFEGLVGDLVPDPHVYLSSEWLDAGHPTSRKMILIRGGRDPGGTAPIDESAHLLDQACGSISSRLMMRDSGYAWKQRFFPQLGEPLWRIEIREYDCGSSNSKEIFPIPPR